jgi:hypothetical protein
MDIMSSFFNSIVCLMHDLPIISYMHAQPYGYGPYYTFPIITILFALLSFNNSHCYFSNVYTVCIVLLFCPPDFEPLTTDTVVTSCVLPRTNMPAYQPSNASCTDVRRQPHDLVVCIPLGAHCKERNAQASICGFAFTRRFWTAHHTAKLRRKLPLNLPLFPASLSSALLFRSYSAISYSCSCATWQPFTPY